MAWFDGACEPENPGGIGTYGFVVDDPLGSQVAAAGGLVDAVPGVRMTNNVAEYMALLRLLDWLLAHQPGVPVVAHGDSRLVVFQVQGTWASNLPHLTALRDMARRRIADHGAVTLAHVPRAQNGRADALTHDAYVEALQADTALRERFQHTFASKQQLAALRAAGIPTYPFMGKREASRLLARRPAAGDAAQA